MDSKQKLFISILAIAILIGIVQFRLVDLNTSARYAAINLYNTPNIIEIGQDESPSFRQMYNMYLALAEVAPRSHVILPESGSFSGSEFRTRTFGYGLADNIEYREYDFNDTSFLPHPDNADALEGSEYRIVASGEGGERGRPWTLVVDTESLESQREFTALRWYRVPGDYRVLFIETSLIPENAVEGLDT